MIALTHIPSPRLQAGERTHLPREPLDPDLALRQHQAYRSALAACGCEVRLLAVNGDLPDAVFIEDTAVVLDEIAIITRMGAPSRAAEPGGVAPVLGRYRPLERLDAPATLEGGDVLRIGRTLLVGLTGRTNRAGAEALASLARPLGYQVRPVELRGCLHLKTAVTALPDGRLLANPAWLAGGELPGFEIVPVHPEEPFAANVALAGDRVVMSAAHPRTTDQVHRLGFEVTTVELSEFAKAEGAVTCLSLLFEPQRRPGKR